MITNATDVELHLALGKINAEYDNNVEFNNLVPEGKRMRFTLRVKDSHKPGHRRGFQTEGRFAPKDGRGRHLISACWHVHGDFFDALFEVNPKAWVKTGKRKITKEQGNWEDWNIGSMMRPMYFSEACDCER